MSERQDMRRIEFLADLDPRDVDAIDAIATRKVYPTGATIFAEGDPPGPLRFLVRGLVSLRQQIEDSENTTQMCSLSRKGDVFGISVCIGLHESYRAGAYCLEESEVVEVDSTKLFQLFEQKPELGVRVLLRFSQHLAKRLSDAREQIRSRVRRGLISQG